MPSYSVAPGDVGFPNLYVFLSLCPPVHYFMAIQAVMGRPGFLKEPQNIVQFCTDFTRLAQVVLLKSIR